MYICMVIEYYKQNLTNYIITIIEHILNNLSTKQHSNISRENLVHISLSFYILISFTY